MPIPNVLNVALVLTVVGTAIALMWLGSRVTSWWAIVGMGIVFSYVLLTNYGLLHEAIHENLHSNPRINYVLGVVTGALFPVPFSLIHTTHQGHHLRNRTDFEMFDLYYPTDYKLIKYSQWYSIMCGLFWPIIPLGALIFAVCPALLRTGPFRTAKSSSYLLGDVRTSEIRAIRLELLAIVAFFAACFFLLHLRWLNLLVLYACFAFNWSTRQYIGHAFSKRDVVEGAWNLRHHPLMSWILLHGEYDLNHHRRPDVSWVYLPQLCDVNDPRPSYWKQYWRQWLGPRQATEPAPEALQDCRLSIHD